MTDHASSSGSVSPHADFPVIAVAIIGVFATVFVLLFYYIFIIKNKHRIDIVDTSHEPTGLHESVIRSIPIFQFQKLRHSHNECGVCLGEFQDDEKLRIIPNCAHAFHIDCIDVWLQNNPNCPLCRNSISSISMSSNILLPDHPPQVHRDEQDCVVIELHRGSDGG
ncbi:hypothetical protein QVD17_27973 [Tagetes erecta]|uniref:RING-type E3 ubiquitin transferase n=1 Tax=Tagetes erecta TaxID=13708 RepID=A0AAD8KCY7_TARER|nr:hypothetical protein QVD17_27973 [Tagetes erecta]